MNRTGGAVMPPNKFGDFLMLGRLVATVLYGAFFIVAHQPSGAEIFINAEQVDYVGPGFDGDVRAGSKVMVYGVWVFTIEKPSEIKAKIDHVLGQDK
jgi:hypothetical protein